jgi:putative transposase
MRDTYHISELCQALQVSKSGYYAARGRTPGPRQHGDEQLLVAIQEIHGHRHTRCYGSPRMTAELRQHGHTCSVNRVARLMRGAGLRARPRKPYRPKTTRPDHAACPSPNLLAAATSPQVPGTHLVSDITYIPTREGWLYLVVVLDLFSRCILGWKLAETMESGLITAALRRAFDTGLVAPQAIFHSDRGSQYSSGPTRRLLKRLGWQQSMSAVGYCYDNAFAESLFASIKRELLPEEDIFPSKSEAHTAIFDYLECFYNRRRLHSALGYQSPQKFLTSYFQNQQPQLN